MTAQRSNDYVPSIGDIFGWIFLFALIGVSIWYFGFMLPKVVKEESKVAESRRAFIAECIEHHAKLQCESFWEYGRTDLGRKR